MSFEFCYVYFCVLSILNPQSNHFRQRSYTVHITTPYNRTTSNTPKQSSTLTTSIQTAPSSPNNGLNSNHNPISPTRTRKSQIRLCQTRRRHLQLARSLTARLTLPRRHETVLTTPRNLLTTDEPLANKPTTAKANTQSTPNIRSQRYLSLNLPTQTNRLPSPNPPHNTQHDRNFNLPPHNPRRNAPLPTLVSFGPSILPPFLPSTPNPNPVTSPPKPLKLIDEKKTTGTSPNPKPVPAGTRQQLTQAQQPSRRLLPKCANIALGWNSRSRLRLPVEAAAKEVRTNRKTWPFSAKCSGRASTWAGGSGCLLLCGLRWMGGDGWSLCRLLGSELVFSSSLVSGTSFSFLFFSFACCCCCCCRPVWLASDCMRIRD